MYDGVNFRPMFMGSLWRTQSDFRIYDCYESLFERENYTLRRIDLIPNRVKDRFFSIQNRQQVRLAWRKAIQMYPDAWFSMSQSKIGRWSFRT